MKFTILLGCLVFASSLSLLHGYPWSDNDPMAAVMAQFDLQSRQRQHNLGKIQPPPSRALGLSFVGPRQASGNADSTEDDYYDENYAYDEGDEAADDDDEYVESEEYIL